MSEVFVVDPRENIFLLVVYDCTEECIIDKNLCELLDNVFV